jgi:Tfp pilus assembly protein PilO
MIRRYAVAGAIALVVVLLLFLVLVKPKFGQISKVRTQVTTEQTQTQTLQIRLRELQSLAANAQKTQAQLAALDRALPPTPDLVSLIPQLQSAATLSGIDLMSIAPSPPSALSNATGVQTISVNLQVTGGFFRLETFLTRLESTIKRVIEVQSLAISPQVDATTGLTTLSSTITCQMYVVQANAHAAGPAPLTPRPTASATPSPTPTRT